MGWLTSARASATRCCCPPDSSQVRRCLVAGQADELERLADPAGLVGLRGLLLAQPVAHVLADVHVREQGVVLEHRVDVPAIGRHPGDRLAGQIDLARRRLLEARDHPQGRGLAAARWPEERVERAARDRQAHGVDGGHVVEALGHVDDRDVRDRVRVDGVGRVLGLGVGRRRGGRAMIVIAPMLVRGRVRRRRRGQTRSSTRADRPPLPRPVRGWYEAARTTSTRPRARRCEVRDARAAGVARFVRFRGRAPECRRSFSSPGCKARRAESTRGAFAALPRMGRCTWS